jgi:hypothetical protein
MDRMDEGRHTRRRATLNRNLKVTTHPVVALRTTTIVAGLVTLIEAKMETRTEDSETRIVDTDESDLDAFLLVQKEIQRGPLRRPGHHHVLRCVNACKIVKLEKRLT